MTQRQKLIVLLVITNIITALGAMQYVKNSLNMSKIGDFLQVKDGPKYIYLRAESSPNEVLKDSKFDKCVVYGGIGVDLGSKNSEGYVVKNIIKKSPADKDLRKGDIITSDLSIIRGRVGDPAKVYFKRVENILLPPVQKEAFMTLKPITKCYLK